MSSPKQKIPALPLLPPLSLFALLSLLLLLTAAPLSRPFAQVNNNTYAVIDGHFHGILFPEVYKHQVSTRVRYPGLYTPEENTAAFGLLPDRLLHDPHSGRSAHVGWDALYGWADVNTQTSGVGVYLGDLHAGASYQVHEYLDMAYSWDTRDFSLRGALWATPAGRGALRGLSAAVNIDNTYAFNGNEHDGLTSVVDFYININTLFALGASRNLRVGLYTHNRYADEPRATRFANSRHYRDGFIAALVDDKLRAIEFRFENAYAINYMEEVSDTVSFALDYSRGTMYTYARHKLYVGAALQTSARFVSEVDNETGSFQYVRYLQNLTGGGHVLSASAALPVALDISLFGSARAMLSVAPRINYSRVAPLRNVDGLRFTPEQSALYLNTQHRFALEMDFPELSLHGLAGDRVDFTLKPTLNNNVFISALELRVKI